MNSIYKRLRGAIHKRYPEHGSALLVSLMVMVGLSLLGLSFVAISETETAISAHERDSDQALDAAEAGAKMVVEWFQSPDWARGSTTDFLPQNIATFKNARTYVSGGNTINDYYKQDTTLLLFDRPFALNTDRFFGTEAWPDVVINYSTTEGTAFLNKLNTKMFTITGATSTTGNPESVEGGGVRITDIRVFAPPIIGGNLNANGRFWDNNGLPYGLATIKVTAQKFGPSDAKLTNPTSGRPLATRYVKIVVAPWPFPGPQGPIQANANISTGGGVGVHWGKMTSEGTMYIKRPWVSLNWLDAWDRPHFEHGYDSSSAWQPSHTYAVGEVVHPTAGPTTTNYAYVCTTAGSTVGAGTEPNWTANAATSTLTINDNGTLVWTRRDRMSFPNDTSYPTYPTANQYNWLYQLINKSYEDLWFEARARGDILNATGVGLSTTQPYPYDDPSLDPTNNPNAGYSCWFQKQTSTVPQPSRLKQVVFPRIDYNFWKDIALSGQGTQGVYYLQWVSGENYTNGVTTQDFGSWVNTVTGAQPGFYFFETQNKQNPQGPGAPGILAPAIALNSSDAGHTFQMAGFIYLNCSFGTSGIGGPDGYQAYPGEPYRDVGFRTAAEATTPAVGTTPAQTKGKFYVIDAAGTPLISGSANGGWDWQDLEWSNSKTDGTAAYATSKNGKLDLYLKNQTVKLADGTSMTAWLPVMWYPGCHPGDNAQLDTGGTPDPKGCSEPHEPYLNVQYYKTSAGISRALESPNKPQGVSIGWNDPTNDVYISKKLTGGSPVACTGVTTAQNWVDCTSNLYDRDGPLVNDIKPILNGVLYMEGDMNSTGNAPYYGSVLINGSVNDTGTPDVWFDETLIKNEWPPSSMNFPRVYVSSIQTDQQ